MTEPNPLSSTNPFSLEELFSLSPLERKPEEWKIVVEALRSQREKWVRDEEAGKKTKATKIGGKAAKAPKIELSIDDLEF
jgi:hypothetical protein